MMCAMWSMKERKKGTGTGRAGKRMGQKKERKETGISF